MDRKEHLIRKLREFVRKSSERIDISKMIFFGSMAVGASHKDSDIDLIIVSPSFKDIRFWKRAVGLYEYWDLDYPVDFLCFTPEEFNEKSKGVTIISEALKEGIVIT